MKRGTTPTFTFNLPFDTSLLLRAYITVKYRKDNNTEILEKTLSDCKKYDNILAVTLSQEETLKFQSGTKAEIELRVVYNNGNGESAEASPIYTIEVDRILKEGVI